MQMIIKKTNIIEYHCRILQDFNSRRFHYIARLNFNQFRRITLFENYMSNFDLFRYFRDCIPIPDHRLSLPSRPCPRTTIELFKQIEAITIPSFVSSLTPCSLH